MKPCQIKILFVLVFFIKNIKIKVNLIFNIKKFDGWIIYYFMDKDIFLVVELFIINLGIYHDYESLLQWRALNKFLKKPHINS
jgi:hypothetical protein